MATGLSLYVVSVLAAVSIFVLLEARPLTRRIDALIRRGHVLVEDDSNLPISREAMSEASDGTEDRSQG
jgi:hypothetical protein